MKLLESSLKTGDLHSLGLLNLSFSNLGMIGRSLQVPSGVPDLALLAVKQRSQGVTGKGKATDSSAP